MKIWTKFKIIIFTPIRTLKHVFNFLFPQVITIKCKTCGELKNIDKLSYIARETAIRKNQKLESYLNIDCNYCHETKFELFKKKKRRIKFVSELISFIKKVIEKVYNVIIFTIGNLLAEIWKIIRKLWQDDLYFYLKTIISFFGICVGAILLSQLLGLKMIVSFALTFAFFVMNVVKTIINRRK